MKDDPTNGDLKIMKTIQKLRPNTKLFNSTGMNEFTNYSKGSANVNITERTEYWQNNICPKGYCGMFNFQINSQSLDDIAGTSINKRSVMMASFAKNSTLYYASSNAQFPIEIHFPTLSCHDTTSLTEIFEGVKKRQPPTNLIESYYKCTKNFKSAFMASLGNGNSTAHLFVGFLMMFVLFSMKTYVGREGKVLIAPRVKALKQTKNVAKHDKLLTKIATILHREGKLDDDDLECLFDYESDVLNDKPTPTTKNPISRNLPTIKDKSAIRAHASL